MNYQDLRRTVSYMKHKGIEGPILVPSKMALEILELIPSAATVCGASAWRFPSEIPDDEQYPQCIGECDGIQIVEDKHVPTMLPFSGNAGSFTLKASYL